jgi:hypothetical protein
VRAAAELGYIPVVLEPQAVLGSLRPPGWPVRFPACARWGAPLPPLEDGRAVVAVHLGDEAEADFFGANGFAGAGDGAVAEAFLVHLAGHVEDAAEPSGRW